MRSRNSVPTVGIGFNLLWDEFHQALLFGIVRALREMRAHALCFVHSRLSDLLNKDNFADANNLIDGLILTTPAPTDFAATQWG